MGNTQTQRVNTPKKEEKQDKTKKKEKEKVEEEEERKAAITITPWSNEERNARFSEIEVEKDDEFVSTIFNITIQEIEQKHDDNFTATANGPPGTDNVKGVKSVMFKHNSPMLGEVAAIHSVVDSKDNEKTVDYITLTLELEIAKNLVIYTYHQYNGNKWTKTEIKQKVGCSTVEVDVYDFTTETIFFTLRYMCEEVIVPSGGFEYKNDFCTHQRITFPEGAVEENMKITINTMSIEDECKRKRLKEEMGSDTSISSLSDIVYVHHSQPFKKKVQLRLKLDPLFSASRSSETFLFHCDDNGCLKVLENVKMRKVPEEEVRGDNVYEVEVDTFSGIGGFQGDPRRDHSRTLTNTYGLGRDQCRILVFLYKEDYNLHLWSDIVPEKKWKRRKCELQSRDGLIFLKNTVSPSVPVKNFGRLRISVLNHGRLLAAPVVTSNSTLMYYDRNAREIYNHFPVVVNTGTTNEMGVIQYEIDTAPRRLLHTAYINADLYLVGLKQPVPARQERHPQRSRTQPQPSRQISRQPGARRTQQSDGLQLERQTSRHSEARRISQSDELQLERQISRHSGARRISQSDEFQLERQTSRHSGARRTSQLDELQLERQTSQLSGARRISQSDELQLERQQPREPGARRTSQSDELQLERQTSRQPGARRTSQSDELQLERQTSREPGARRTSQSDELQLERQTSRHSEARRISQSDELQLERQTSREPGVRRTSQAKDTNNDLFSKQSLFFLAREIPTTKIWELMLQLGLRLNQIENIRSATQSDNEYKMALILFWNNENETKRKPPSTKLAILCGALKDVELAPIADTLESVYSEHRSLRTGDFSN